MISSVLSLATLVAAAAASPEVALYWGQNSAGNEKSLGDYCKNSPGDIYIISFINDFGNGTPMTMNIHGYYNYIEGTHLLEASSLGSEIEQCQQLGKKVLISLGGAVGNYGLASAADAESVATDLWNYFGGGSSSTRPFGEGVKLDGFDFDIENSQGTAEYATLVNKLKELYGTDSSKSYYTSAAPQCPFPDSYLGQAISNGHFDYLFVQFYNNYCNAAGNDFNFDTWQNFASTQSPNKDVKVFTGLAGSPSAASGYATIDEVKAKYCDLVAQPNFGGFSLWDASQANSNSVDGKSYVQQLESLSCPSASSSSSAAAPSTSSSSTAAVTTPVSTTKKVLSSASPVTSVATVTGTDGAVFTSAVTSESDVPYSTVHSTIYSTSSAPYYANSTTVKSTNYVTVPCSSTTLSYGGSVYTVSEATTLTLEDCSCTEGSSLVSSIAATASPSENPAAPGVTTSTAAAVPSGSAPAASGPASSAPVASGPASSGPVASGPASSTPVASGPASSGPVASGPASSGPVASGPASSGPVASGPAPSGPVASVPAPSGPAANNSAPVAPSGPAPTNGSVPLAPSDSNTPILANGGVAASVSVAAGIIAAAAFML